MVDQTQSKFTEPYGKFTLSFTLSVKIGREDKVTKCVYLGQSDTYAGALAKANKALASLPEVVMYNIQRGHTKEWSDERNI